MDDPRARWLEQGDVVLHALDFGGTGPPVLLVHGLAGYAGEWAQTASWLRDRNRVLAVDQRGHGESTRVPSEVTPTAFVDDVFAWLDSLEISRAALVGQSFGGLIAFLAAASRPARVTRLIVSEASPSADPHAEPRFRRWVESWPVPFEGEQAAISYFGGDSDWARAWAGGLEIRADGLWPRFDQGTLVKTLQASASSHWEAWEAVQCPTLIVRGEHGLALVEAQEMARRTTNAVVETVRGAAHDVHLERPAEWRRVVERFLRPDARSRGSVPPTGA